MCGLWGTISSILTKDEKENAMFLAFLSQTRGLDSTGMAVFSRRKKNRVGSNVIRLVDDSSRFLKMKETQNAFSTNETFAIMGHCRAATLGAINLRNCHPIEEGPITLCHNGSIGHFHDPKKDTEHSDSRELAQRIRDKGYQAAFDDTNGSPWAVTWVDYRTRTLNIARNSARSLFLMRSRSNAWYWASEIWMLDAMKTKAGAHLFEEVLTVGLKTKYTWQLGQANYTTSEITDEVEKYRAEAVARMVAERGTWCLDCAKRKTECVCAIRMESRRHIFDQPKKPSLVSDQGFFKGYIYKGWNGQIFTVPRVWDLVCRRGCAGCKATGKLPEPVYWFSDEAWVCQSCYDGNDIVKEHVKGKEVYKSQLIRTGVH